MVGILARAVFTHDVQGRFRAIKKHRRHLIDQAAHFFQGVPGLRQEIHVQSAHDPGRFHERLLRPGHGLAMLAELLDVRIYSGHGRVRADVDLRCLFTYRRNSFNRNGW